MILKQAYCVLCCIILCCSCVLGEQNMNYSEAVQLRLDASDLLVSGETRIYEGNYLEAISMPVGGIGAGCIQMNGQAKRAVWQIFNNFRYISIPDSFFAVRSQVKNKNAVIRALQTTNEEVFEKMERLTFRGEYPFGWYDFQDTELPVRVAMEVFSPLIPLNAKDSGIPCAVFNIQVSNPTDAEVEVSLLATQKNVTGFISTEDIIWPGPADGEILSDFEGKNYGQWTTTGDAFGFQPMHEKIHKVQQLEGFKGDGYVNTYGQRKDQAIGTLKSPTFTVRRGYIHFLIGGGNYPQKTCINLWIDGKKVKTAMGNVSDQMRWCSWDVSAFNGKAAYIEIVDEATGIWGHIEIDHIIFSDEPGVSTLRIVGLGQNRNQIVSEKDHCKLLMTTDRKPYDQNLQEAREFCTSNGLDKFDYDKGIGEMCLMSLSENVQGVASWTDNETLHNAWLAGDHLNGQKTVGPSEQGKTYNGALVVPFTLKPLETKTISFVLTWHFPNVKHGFDIEGPSPSVWCFLGNMYTNWWSNASDVADYIRNEFQRLEQQSRLYHDTLYKSNLPYWLLDRISSQVAVLRSKTFFWAKDDYFGAWEGCGRDDGSCGGMCTHVYHYAQAHARLFPDLAKKIREESFHYQKQFNYMPERHGVRKVVLDGMCGEILSTYREYLTDSDETWIRKNGINAIETMNDAIQRWDVDEDGVLSGQQGNTLDCKITGNSSWLGTLYLSALAASEGIATILGDTQAMCRYKKIRQSGAVKQNERLWNGQYYIQIPNPNLPGENYITGCSIDQVLGEWWASQLGLPHHYPIDRIRMALNSLLRYNFKCNFMNIVQKPREFVVESDAGMQMITWPNVNNRPTIHTLYADEVMTGFEYSAAAAMIQCGMLSEGYMIVKAVSDRYDGRMRTGLTPGNTASWGYSGNPFGDDECGKFYGRAMSVWSTLLASQGFLYNGPEKIIGFDPQWQPDNHISFFTASKGWGLFEQKRNDQSQMNIIRIAYGSLDISEIHLAIDQKYKLAAAKVKVAGTAINPKIHSEGEKIVLRFNQSVHLTPDGEMEISLDVNE